MCACITELSAKIIEMKKEETKNKATIGEGRFSRMGLSFTEGKWRTYQEFEYEVTPIKVNGEMGKQHKKRVSVYHSYCPFCGETIDNLKTNES